VIWKNWSASSSLRWLAKRSRKQHQASIPYRMCSFVKSRSWKLQSLILENWWRYVLFVWSFSCLLVLLFNGRYFNYFMIFVSIQSSVVYLSFYYCAVSPSWFSRKCFLLMGSLFPIKFLFFPGWLLTIVIDEWSNIRRTFLPFLVLNRVI